MQKVTEAIIDDLVEYYESVPETLVNKTSQYMDEYPTLLAYLEQESNHVLTDEERDLQWYIVVVCISAVLEAELEIREFTVEGLSNAEEYNWELLQSIDARSWRARLTPFFDSFPEEDLLAFVEDMIEEDEDSPITPIGREVIFVTAMSVLDCIFDHSVPEP